MHPWELVNLEEMDYVASISKQVLPQDMEVRSGGCVGIARYGRQEALRVGGHLHFRPCACNATWPQQACNNLALSHTP